MVRGQGPVVIVRSSVVEEYELYLGCEVSLINIL